MTKEKKNKTTYGRMTSWALRILVVFIVFIALFLGGMNMLSGTGEIHKSGIEQALSEMFAVRAEIETLEDLRFFPVISFKAQDIKFYERGGDKQQVHIAHLDFQYSFWHFLFGRKVIQTLSIEGVNARPGYLGPQRLKVTTLKIEPEEEKTDVKSEKGHLNAIGTYGGKPFKVNIALEKEKEGYLFPAPTAFTFDFDTLKLAGLLSIARDGTLTFKDTTFGADKTLFTGALEKAGADIKTNIKIGRSAFKANLDMTGGLIKGTVEAAPFDIGDQQIIDKVLADLGKALSFEDQKNQDESIDLFFSDLDIKLDIKSLQYEGKLLGHAVLPVVLKSGDLTIKPIKGAVNAGALSGFVALEAKEKPAKLTAELTLKKWDFGAFQKQFFGEEDVSAKADIVLNLAGSGNSYKEIIADLNGRASLVAGEGRWKSAALVNSWGASLFNVILPDLDPESETVLNCAIADFTLEKGVATSDTLFMDTKRVVLQGGGTINFPEEKLSIKLSPDTKDPALLDVSTAVRIKGPFDNISVGPDALSLGKKVGGLLLGAVNPAFLVLSLTDLGLAENHPCHKFIKTQSEEKK